jgi:hypothetical protein
MYRYDVRYHRVYIWLASQFHDLKININKETLYHTRVRCEVLQITFFRYTDSSVKLFSPHVWVIESLQMNDEDLRKPKDGEVFMEIIHSFALCTLIPTFFHFLWLDELFETFIQVHISCDPHTFPWYWNAQIHKVIKCITAVTTMLALYLIHQLTCEEVGYDRVISFFIVFPPVIALFIYCQLIKVHFLVFGLL